MDLLLILMRLLHVGLGAFWAGTMIFQAFFLGPSLQDAGPDGAKVMSGLMRRHMVEVIPAAAGLTVLSGLYLYWRASVGFQPAYMRSGPGITYGLGALAAILALVLGLAFVRPAMLKAIALGQQAATAAPNEREAIVARAQALRLRAATMQRLLTALVIITVVAMAVGRYV